MNNISSILALRSQDYSTFNVYRSISSIVKVICSVLIIQLAALPCQLFKC